MFLKKTCYWIFFLFVSTTPSENSDPCQETGFPWYEMSNGWCCPCEECPEVYVRGKNLPVESKCLNFKNGRPPDDGTPRFCATTCSQHCRPMKDVLLGKHNDLIDKKCTVKPPVRSRPPPSEIPTTTKPTSPLSIAKNTSKVPSQAWKPALPTVTFPTLWSSARVSFYKATQHNIHSYDIQLIRHEHGNIVKNITVITVNATSDQNISYTFNGLDDKVSYSVQIRENRRNLNGKFFMEADWGPSKMFTVNKPPYTTPVSTVEDLNTTALIVGLIAAVLVFVLLIAVFVMCTKLINCGQTHQLIRCCKGSKSEDADENSLSSAESRSSMSSSVIDDSRQDIGAVVPRNPQPPVDSDRHSGAVLEGSRHPGASSTGIPTAAGSNVGAPQNTPMMSLGNNPVVHGSVHQAAGDQHIVNNYYLNGNGNPLPPEQHLVNGEYHSDTVLPSYFASSDFRGDDDPTKLLTSEQPKAFTAPAPVRDAANFPIRTTLTEQDQVSGPADTSFTKDFNRILNSSQSTSRFTETDDTFVKSVVESEPRRSPSYEMRIGQSARTGYGYSSIGYSVQETQPSSQFDSHELPTEERRLIRNEETSEDTDEETNEETV